MTIINVKWGYVIIYIVQTVQAPIQKLTIAGGGELTTCHRQVNSFTKPTFLDSQAVDTLRTGVGAIFKVGGGATNAKAQKGPNGVKK